MKLTITKAGQGYTVEPTLIDGQEETDLPAQAGDLTTFAYRDRIYLIRENADGQKDFHQLDINDANIISSPYYNLQQNDVIYVEQKKIQARNAFISANTSIWFSLASSLMSIATFILALSK